MQSTQTVYESFIPADNKLNIPMNSHKKQFKSSLRTDT